MNKLIMTKLCKPSLGRLTIRRARILDLLNRRSDVSVLMLSAPAGFGKSTLLVQWAEMLTQPYCWLSIDDGDKDPLRFITYLTSALLANIEQDQLQQRALDKFQRDGNAQELLQHTLSFIKQPITLFLDDIHLLAESKSAELLNLLINSRPPNVQLVMAGRYNRFVDLSAMRLALDCLDLNEKDLKFDYHEAVLVVNRKVTPWFGKQAHLISQLYQATEGWPAGIQLAVLAQQHSTHYQPRAINQQTVDYLMAQAISQIDQQLQDFLLASCFLERFNPELANLISHNANAAMLINQLEIKNLFIINLDISGQWYRYHQLFRQVLQSIALARGVDDKAIYAKAYQWCVTQGLNEEAINYALLSGDIDSAVTLVDKLVEHCIKQGLFLRVEQWIRQIPDDKLSHYPHLILHYAWALAHLGKIDQARQMLESLSKLDKNQQQMAASQFMYQYYAVKMVIAVACDDLLKIQQLLVKCPTPNEQYGFSNGVIHNTLAIALTAFNQPQQAISEANLALESHQNCDSMIGVIFANCIKAMARIQCGELIGAAADVQQGYQLLQYHRISENSLLYMVIRVIDGVIHYFNAQTKQAVLLLSECVPYMDDCAYIDLRNICYITLARSLSQDGDVTTGESMLNKALLSNYESIKYRTQAKIAYEKFRIHLEHQQTDQALDIIEQQELSKLPLPPIKQWDDISCYRQLTHCLYLIYHVDTSDSTQEINQRLDQLIELTTTANRRLQQLEILLIKSLFLSHQQQKNQCAATLKLAITLAQKNKIYAPFCQQLITSDSNITFILSNEHPLFYRHLTKSSQSSADSKPPLEREPEQKSVLLSTREQSILTLIATGQSNKAIAGQLSLSVNTIRWHVSNILSKLMVSNRTAAVATARNLGVLN